MICVVIGASELARAIRATGEFDIVADAAWGDAQGLTDAVGQRSREDVVFVMADPGNATGPIVASRLAEIGSRVVVIAYSDLEHMNRYTVPTLICPASADQVLGVLMREETTGRNHADIPTVAAVTATERTPAGRSAVPAVATMASAATWPTRPADPRPWDRTVAPGAPHQADAPAKGGYPSPVRTLGLAVQDAGAEPHTPTEREVKTEAKQDHRSGGTSGVGRRRRRLYVGSAIGGVIVVALSLVAVRNYGSAQQWKQQAHVNATNAAHLTAQRDGLQAQLSSLTTKNTGLQQQVAEVANEKARAQDNNAVLTQALAYAGKVADALQSCVSATDTFNSELTSASDFFSIEALLPQAEQVDQLCQAAETANQELQSELKGS